VVNASFLEITQTLTAFFGALMTLRAKVTADLNLVSAMRRGLSADLMIIAYKNVRVERGILYVQTILFVGGLATLFLAPPPFAGEQGSRTPLEIQRVQSTSITRLATATGSFILMVVSYKNWLENRIPIRRSADVSDSSMTSITSKAQEVIELSQATTAKATAVIQEITNGNDKSGESK
jgi:hypothetical protein